MGNIWDELGNEADDKVRRNNADKEYNERAENYNEKVVEPINKFVENNPDRAKEMGLEKLDKIDKKEYNPLEHLKDEMAADSYKNTHFSDRELKKTVGIAAGASMRFMAGRASEEREEEERIRAAEKRLANNLREFSKKAKPWIAFCTVLGGVAGGVGFAFIPDGVRSDIWYVCALVPAVVFAIGAWLSRFLLCPDFYAGWWENLVNVGCSGCVMAPVGAGGGVLLALVMFVPHIPESITLITVGALVGVFTSLVMGIIIYKGIYNWKNTLFQNSSEERNRRLWIAFGTVLGGIIFGCGASVSIHIFGTDSFVTGVFLLSSMVLLPANVIMTIVFGERKYKGCLGGFVVFLVSGVWIVGVGVEGLTSTVGAGLICGFLGGMFGWIVSRTICKKVYDKCWR